VSCPIHLRRRLVKGKRLHRIRTPSIDECSLPRSRCLRTCTALARAATGSRGDCRLPGRNPACDEPVSLLACSWPSPLRPGSGAASPAALPRRESRWARPSPVKAEDQAPLVDFCNPNTPRAPPRDRPIPAHRAFPSARFRAVLVSPACARENPKPPPGPRLAPGTRLLLREAPRRPWNRGFRLELGRGWPPHHSLTERRPGSCDPERRPCPTDACAPIRRGESAASANRGFTGQGQMAFAAGTSCRWLPGGRRTCRSFAPTRSARTPPVVVSPRRRRETPALPAIPPRAASPVLPRRSSEIRRTRGAFHR